MKHPNTPHVAISMRRARLRAGYRPEEVAAAAGISASTLQRYELGKTPIRLVDAVALADMYGISLDLLAGRVPQRGIQNVA